MTSKNTSKPAGRRWVVRDSANGARYFFDTREEAERFFDSVCTENGVFFSHLAKRLWISPNPNACEVL